MELDVHWKGNPPFLLILLQVAVLRTAALYASRPAWKGKFRCCKKGPVTMWRVSERELSFKSSNSGTAFDIVATALDVL
jgi:hypothetical protein